MSAESLLASGGDAKSDDVEVAGFGETPILSDTEEEDLGEKLQEGLPKWPANKEDGLAQVAQYYKQTGAKIRKVTSILNLFEYCSHLFLQKHRNTVEKINLVF